MIRSKTFFLFLFPSGSMCVCYSQLLQDRRDRQTGTREVRYTVVLVHKGEYCTVSTVHLCTSFFFFYLEHMTFFHFLQTAARLSESLWMVSSCSGKSLSFIHSSSPWVSVHTGTKHTHTHTSTHS